MRMAASWFGSFDDTVFDDPPNTRLWRDGATPGRLDSGRLVRWRLPRGRRRLTRGCRSAPTPRQTHSKDRASGRENDVAKSPLDNKSPIQGWGEGVTMIPYRTARTPSSHLLPNGEKE